VVIKCNLHVVGGDESIGLITGNDIEDLLLITSIAGSVPTSLRCATEMMGEGILCDDVKRNHSNTKNKGKKRTIE
jgi:hypothetical protein